MLHSAIATDLKKEHTALPDALVALCAKSPLISPPRDWHVLEVIIRTLERRLHGFALLLLLKLTISQALRAVVPELPLAVHDQRRRHNPRHLHSESFLRCEDKQ